MTLNLFQILVSPIKTFIGNTLITRMLRDPLNKLLDHFQPVFIEKFKEGFHFVKGLSGVEGRGSPPRLGSSILLQPLRNHDTPEDALNRDPTPLRLVLDPAELVAVILNLEGGRAPSLRGKPVP